MDPSQQSSKSFSLRQARQLADVLKAERVDYLFIGKGAALILGYPGTTQDVDIYVPKDRENAQRLAHALERLGFKLDETLRSAILKGKDFIQIKNGPFDVDLVFAPDGIKDYPTAKARSIEHEGFPIANLKDIIASKRAAARPKDLYEVYQLEEFAKEYERAHAKPLLSAAEKFAHRKPRVERK